MTALRVIVTLCAAVGIGSFATMISLVILGPALQLSDDGMTLAAFVLLPVWALGLMPVVWRASREFTEDC